MRRALLVPAVPQGTALDPCAGLVAFLADRPPVPSYYSALGFAFFGCTLLAVLATNLAWFLLRHEPRLAKGRSFAVNVFANVGLVIASSAITLRLGLFSSDAYNSTQMSCWLSAFLCLWGVGMVATAAALRIFILYSRTLFARLVGMMEQGSDDASASVASDQSLHRADGQLARTFDTIVFMWFSLVHTLQQKKPWRSAVTDLSSSRAVDSNVRMQEIQRAGLAGSFQGLAFLCGLGMATVTVVVVGVIFSSPVYYSGCVGCDLYLPVLMGSLVMGVNAVAFFSYLFYLMRGSPWDEYGVKWELLLWGVFVAGTYLAVGFLMFLDINSYGINNEFAWDWLVMCTVSAFVVVWDIMPVYQAYRDSRARRAAEENAATGLRLTDQQLIDGIMRNLDNPDFEKLCERMFVIELLRFLSEVKMFIELYFDRADNWRRVKALSIYERYIANLSPLQINLSHELRREIEKAIKASPTAMPQREVFDKAVKETLHMLKPVFKRFAMHNTSVVVVIPENKRGSKSAKDFANMPRG